MDFGTIFGITGGSRNKFYSQRRLQYLINGCIAGKADLSAGGGGEEREVGEGHRHPSTIKMSTCSYDTISLILCVKGCDAGGSSAI